MRRIALLLLLLIIARPASAQPVDLGIPNLPQQTDVWCWAAVAEQIIRWRKWGQGLGQCELVSIANGFPAPYCCDPRNAYGSPVCRRTGHIQEIAALINHFGGGYARIAPPTHPAVLYQALASGRPIILALSSGFGGHVVVVRGMLPAPDPLLLVNDPMSWITQPVPFSWIMPYWQAAIVVD